MNQVTSTANHYPIPRQTPDYRLGFGLLADFRALLVRHGFPEFGPGDLAELHQALDRFVYGPTDGPTPHRYPQLMAWAQAHGDRLVREAERRGLADLDTLLTTMLDDVFAIYVDESDLEIEEQRLDLAGDLPAERPTPDMRVISRQEAAALGLMVAADGGVQGFQAAHSIPEPVGADVEDQYKRKLARLLGVPAKQLSNQGNFYYHDRIRHLFYSPTSAGGWVVDGPPPGDGLPEYRRDDEPPTNGPLPPGVEGRPLGGRQEGTPQ